MFSRFHLIPERKGQTDRQTDGRTDRDRFAISISRVSTLTRDKITVKTRKDNGTGTTNSERSYEKSTQKVNRVPDIYWTFKLQDNNHKS